MNQDISQLKLKIKEIKKKEWDDTQLLVFGVVSIKIEKSLECLQPYKIVGKLNTNMGKRRDRIIIGIYGVNEDKTIATKNLTLTNQTA